MDKLEMQSPALRLKAAVSELHQSVVLATTPDTTTALLVRKTLQNFRQIVWTLAQVAI